MSIPERNFHTQRSLREMCGFSELDFRTLWGHVRDDLSNPDNIIGLEGPRKHKEAWNIWVEGYINNGLAVQYWGEGTERKWNMMENAEEIVTFLLLFLRHAAQANRTASIFVKGKQGSSGEYMEDSPITPASRSISKEIPATMARSIKTKATNRRPSSMPTAASNVRSPGYAPGAKVAIATPSLSWEKKRKRKSSLFAIENRSKNTPATVKRASFSVEDIRTTKFESFDLTKFKPIITSKTNVSPAGNSSPLAEGVPEILSTAPPKHLEFVLETKIAGTNQLRIIHVAQTPTLALFINKVAEKCALGPRQHVRGIDIWVGDEYITLDLEEENDWTYITNHVVKDRTRVKAVVWVV